jgi:hypothetical protein
MSQHTSAEYTETFPPTGGRVVGVVAVALCLAVVVLTIFDGEDGWGPAFAFGAAFAGILSYAALLRPGVRAENGILVIRNMLDTNLVPLAVIDEVVVRQVLAIRVDEKRYVSPAIGHSFMRTIRPAKRKDDDPELTYQDYVRDRILSLADGARRRLGSAEPPAVRREWAWLVIGSLVVTFVATVVAIVV